MPRLGKMESPGQRRQSNRTQTRHVNAIRRSTNACQRCKRRKIKCHYTSDNSYHKCVACSRSHSECIFDAPPDGVLRGHAYVATLEARIQLLEKQLCVAESEKTGLTPDTECSGQAQRTQTDTNSQDERSPQRQSTSDMRVLDMLPRKAFASNSEETLPALPSSSGAKALVDTVYFYTQARYCIIDWTQLREWHRDREAIAYASSDSAVSTQTGAFFIWIIYAIGACLVPNPESSTEAYFSRARIYLPAVLDLQNLSTVQALLCLTQYYFRAPTESPIWDLVGLALRLCIKHRYHRKITIPDVDPYTIELRKRFFWCAYCFDRLLAILYKLPFGISDSDIDVDTPVDIDDTCTDQQMICQTQLKQAAGESGDGNITTMTAALHHLQVYRIRSRILTNFTGPHAHIPSLTDVEHLLSELDQWRQQAPRKQDSRSFPQQNPDRVQANYFQAVLLLLRPILLGDVVDPDLIRLCVEFATDACESAKLLSLNPLTLPDRITVYHCFYGGITLLQCLAIKPTALTPRRAHQAISACLSALAVYTRVLPAVAPFLRLFENVSNLFVCDEHMAGIHPSGKVRGLLNRIVSSDPSEASGILCSLSQKESHQASPEPLEEETMTIQYDSILGGQSSVLPIDMPLTISPLYAPDLEIMDLWTGWLDPPSVAGMVE